MRGKKYVLKFNHVLTPQDPYHAAFQKWAAAVSERTNGNLTIEVFPSAQLGVEEDILEQIRQGANVGQNTDAARLGQYVPDIAVHERALLRRDARGSGKNSTPCLRSRHGRRNWKKPRASRCCRSSGCRDSARW